MSYVQRVFAFLDFLVLTFSFVVVLMAIATPIIVQNQLDTPSNPQTTSPSSATNTEKINGHTTNTSQIPQVNINGEPVRSHSQPANLSRTDAEDARWGSNFWVTLVDPQVFISSPSTTSSRV